VCERRKETEGSVGCSRKIKKNQCHLAPLAGKISVSKWNEI
jgi:hypothetical protein